MNRNTSLSLALAAVLASASLPSLAQDAPHALGQHPAVIVAARDATAYDYTTKFYAHPAGLAWRTMEAEPATNGQHPAVLVAEGHGRQGVDPNTFIVGHPASPSWYDEPEAPLAVAVHGAAPTLR